MLEHNEKTIELFIKTKSYADAFINAQLAYAGCQIISIKQSDTTESNGDLNNN